MIRCSLFGHDWVETSHTRWSANLDGPVITRYKRCKRCRTTDGAGQVLRAQIMRRMTKG